MNPFSFILSPFLAEQNRWFLWFPVTILAGIAGYFALPFEPQPSWFALSPLSFILFFAFRRLHALRPLVIGLLGLSLGFNAAQLETRNVTWPQLEAKMEATSITGLLFRTEAMPEGSRLTLKKPSIKGLEKEDRPRFVRVKVRTPFAELPEPGARVNVWGPLWPPSDPVAPGAYDFRRHAFFNQLGATGFSYGELREYEARFKPPFFWDGFFLLFEKARHTLSKTVFNTLDGAKAAMTSALLAGSQTAIDEETMEAMRISGLSHLLSISGVHVSMMALLIYVPLRFLLALFPWVALRYPIKKWAAGTAILFTALYTLLVGADAPTVRSALMTSIVLFAIMIDRKAMSMRLVALAATAIILISPHSAMGPSFQMSFAAVLAMIAAYEKRIDQTLKEGIDLSLPHWMHYLWRSIRDIAMTSILATAATTPFTLFHFQTFSFYGVIANMLAVPLTTLWVMPCLLLTYIAAPFGATSWFLHGAGWGVDGIIFIAQTVAAWPYAQLSGPPMSALSLGLIVSGGLWLCLWQRRWRYAGLLLILIGSYQATQTVTPFAFIAADDPVWAVQFDDGRMAVFGKREENFTIKQWRQRIGNPETLFFSKKKLPSLESEQLSCDADYCAFDKGGERIIFLHETAPAATIQKACANAALTVISSQPLEVCQAKNVIDAKALEDRGSHALAFDRDGRLAVQSARTQRGTRPWSVGWQSDKKN